MGKAFGTLGGNIPNTTLPADLENFKTNDVCPLTLLNDDASMDAVATKVNDMKVSLEDILSNLATHAGEMQAQADIVNAEGKVEW